MYEVIKLSDTDENGVRKASFSTCGLTCSTRIDVEAEGDLVRRVEIINGCDGNTKGLARLCEGRRMGEIVGLLSGIDCKGRGTSCPDQLARALMEMMG
jgi:uncharacterized protein (TIGR03905 family)